MAFIKGVLMLMYRLSGQHQVGMHVMHADAMAVKYNFRQHARYLPTQAPKLVYSVRNRRNFGLHGIPHFSIWQDNTINSPDKLMTIGLNKDSIFMVDVGRTDDTDTIGD
jgi:hypothetical protein